MGDGAVLATDSFLMKGEEMPPNALWGGNPAKKMRERSAGDLQAPETSLDDNHAAVLAVHDLGIPAAVSLTGPQAGAAAERRGASTRRSASATRRA
jgi:hypothetical protein